MNAIQMDATEYFEPIKIKIQILKIIFIELSKYTIHAEDIYVQYMIN